MFTIAVDGKPIGTLYYGAGHVMPIARRMATIRARKGSTERITVIDTRTCEVTEVIS